MVLREMHSALACRIYTNGAQQSARCERFFGCSMIVLLNIRADFPHFMPKSAQHSFIESTSAVPWAAGK
jgi:hypothetical protein